MNERVFDNLFITAYFILMLFIIDNRWNEHGCSRAGHIYLLFLFVACLVFVVTHAVAAYKSWGKK